MVYLRNWEENAERPRESNEDTCALQAILRAKRIDNGAVAVNAQRYDNERGQVDANGSQELKKAAAKVAEEHPVHGPLPADLERYGYERDYEVGDVQVEHELIDAMLQAWRLHAKVGDHEQIAHGREQKQGRVDANRDQIGLRELHVIVDAAVIGPLIEHTLIAIRTHRAVQHIQQSLSMAMATKCDAEDTTKNQPELNWTQLNPIGAQTSWILGWSRSWTTSKRE